MEKQNTKKKKKLRLSYKKIKNGNGKKMYYKMFVFEITKKNRVFHLRIKKS